MFYKKEFVDKEVWNITGGFFPLIPTSNVRTFKPFLILTPSKNKPKEEKAREWIYGGIV